LGPLRQLTAAVLGRFFRFKDSGEFVALGAFVSR
jgi:hypothetical protein